MIDYTGKTVEYRNKYGQTVTATIVRTEKLLYPAGATGLVHLIGDEECVIAWRPGIIKN